MYWLAVPCGQKPPPPTELPTELVQTSPISCRPHSQLLKFIRYVELLLRLKGERARGREPGPLPGPSVASRAGAAADMANSSITAAAATPTRLNVSHKYCLI